MTSVIICSAAEVDFTESLKWYAERGIEAANDFDAEFDRAIFQIAPIQNAFPCAMLVIVIFCFDVFRFG